MRPLGKKWYSLAIMKANGIQEVGLIPVESRNLGKRWGSTRDEKSEESGLGVEAATEESEQEYLLLGSNPNFIDEDFWTSCVS